MWWASWAAAALPSLKSGNIWGHQHTAVLRAKHLHPGGAVSAAVGGSGSLQGHGQTLLIILLSLLSRARLEARSWGHSTAPQPLPELETYISPCTFSHSKRLLYKKLLCYWLDFVSSSLIYSLRQMTAFSRPALRYQSPTQQHQDASAANLRRASMESQSHSIYQLCEPYSSQSAFAQTVKEPGDTLLGMWYVHAHLINHQHCLGHKPGERTMKTTPWSTSNG